jgi:hypothetical protein
MSSSPSQLMPLKIKARKIQIKYSKSSSRIRRTGKKYCTECEIRKICKEQHLNDNLNGKN